MGEHILMKITLPFSFHSDLLGKRTIPLRPTYDKPTGVGLLSRQKCNFFMPMPQSIFQLQKCAEEKGRKEGSWQLP